jgi:hypothetical protein
LTVWEPGLTPEKKKLNPRAALAADSSKLVHRMLAYDGLPTALPSSTARMAISESALTLNSPVNATMRQVLVVPGIEKETDMPGMLSNEEKFVVCASAVSTAK